MIFDRTLLFSNAQAITADAASTDIIDLAATGTVYGAAAALSRDLGKGQRIPLLVQIVESFDNLTSIAIQVQTDDNSGFSSAKTVASETILLAAATAGKQFFLDYLPRGTDERYLRLYYDITGTTPTTGKITAGVVMGVQNN